MSGSTVARLKEKWQGELAIWQGRRLDEVEAVYLWIDGIYVKAGLEKEKAALLVVLAALSDGRKVLVAVTPGYRESTESWAALLRDLKARGLRSPRLVVGDGHLGILGRADRGVSPGPAAALLEPPAPQRAGQVAEAAAARGPTAAHGAPLRRDAGGRRAPEAGVPDVVREEGRACRRPRPRPGLGPARCLLRVPEGALETPANVEPNRVAVRGRPTAARRRRSGTRRWRTRRRSSGRRC